MLAFGYAIVVLKLSARPSVISLFDAERGKLMKMRLSRSTATPVGKVVRL